MVVGNKINFQTGENNHEASPGKDGTPKIPKKQAWNLVANISMHVLYYISRYFKGEQNMHSN